MTSSTTTAIHPSPTPHTTEKTFRSYTATQATSYASYRPGYNPDLIAYILAHHLSTGGGTSRVLDLGTGTGAVIRAFAPYFEEAVGVDPGVEMLREAERVSVREGVRTRGGGALRFVLGAAEECDTLEGVEGGVDLVVAGTAAHWFDMPAVWTAAAKIVKPGGTVALWTLTGTYLHPSQPHREELQALITNFRDVTVAPYSVPGSTITVPGYTTLTLPRDLPASDPAHAAFPAELHHRKDWNRDGECGIDEQYFSGSTSATLERLGKAVGTGSSITRWRQDEGNRGKEDLVDALVREMAEVAGHDVKLNLGMWTALVMCKRA